MSKADRSSLFPGQPHRRWLVAILVAYFTLALIYMLSTPPLEASDEYKHYPVVQYIQTEFKLPVLDPDDPGLWLQEAAQPPLYYLIMAALTSFIDTSDLPEVHQVNPHAFVGNPNQIANKNLVIHDTGNESFPWKGTILAIYVIRLVSIILGAGTIFITARLGALLFNSTVGLFAAGLTAFNPMFVFVTAAVNNDSLAILLGSLATFMLVRLWRDHPDPRKAWSRYAFLGLVIGLGMMTKLSLGGMMALAALAMGWLSWRKRNARYLLGLAIIFLIALLVTVPWFITNITRYGDPFGLSAFIEVQGTRESPITISGWQAEFGTFYRSYWGLFGGVNVAAPEVIYILFNLLAIIGAAGLVIWLYRWRQSQKAAQKGKRSLASDDLVVEAANDGIAGVQNETQLTADDHNGTWLLFAWPLILLILLVRWNTISPAFQGRLIFPAIASVNVLWSVGLLTLIKPAIRQRLAVIVSAIIFVIALILPWRVIRPAYEMPKPLAAVPDGSAFGPITFMAGEGEVQLVGVEVEPNQRIKPGEDPVHLTLYWQAVRPVSQDYLSSIHLIGRDNESAGQVNRYPASGMIPPTRWQSGEIWRDDYRLYVRKTADGPSQLQIRVSLFDTNLGRDLAATGPDGTVIDSLIVGSGVLENDNPVETPTVEQYAEFSNSIALLGYDLLPGTMHVGERVDLVLFWEALATPGNNYTVFIHLIDEEGNQVLVADSPPISGDYPTSLWQAGERIEDRHSLMVPNSLEPGEYAFSIGLYDPNSLTRLSRTDASGDAITWTVSIEE